MKCEGQECDKEAFARHLCKSHYNQIYWEEIASPATLQRRRESYKKSRAVRKLEDYVPKNLRPRQTLTEKKLRVAQQAAFRRHMVREIVNQIKVAYGCVDCGYNDNAMALDFDHVDEKTFTISRMVSSGRPIDRLIEEIEQCVIRCANCHRIKTWENRETISERLLVRLIPWEDEL